MHYEILTEDISGKRMLDILASKIIKTSDSFRVISYKGCGSIPKNLKTSQDAGKRILLEQLPRLLQGYGRTYKDSENCVIIIVCDLDDRNYNSFMSELNSVLENCNPKPNAQFCLAIEEGEAWLLGDLDAIYQAYPKAKKIILKHYVNDSICGTWELLADAIFPGGSEVLKRQSYHQIGATKSEWAEKIAPFIMPERNKSPSFCNFRDTIKNASNKN